MTTVYLILALLVAIVAVIFALQNTAAVTITFFAWTITGSLSLVLLITLAIGVLIGLLFVAPSLIKNSIQASNQRKRVSALEKEVGDHKATIERLQAKVEQLLAARVTPSTPPAPAAPVVPNPPAVSDSNAQNPV